MTITFIGDVMLGENLFHIGRGIRTNFKNKFHELLNTTVQEIFSETDVLMFNMEYSLIENDSNIIEDPRHIVYRGDIESLNFFKNVKGILVANIANNHFSQHGVTSAIYTKQILKKNNILIAGCDNQPLTIETSKKKIRIWGVSLISDSKYCGQYWLSDTKEIIEAISKFNGSKEPNELWILSIHWGNEYIETPQSEQIAFSDLALSNGIDIIAVHHPHVTQPIYSLREKFTIFSLGNFIFDQNFSKKTQEGLIVMYDDESKKIEKVYKTRQIKYVIRDVFETTVEEFNFSKNEIRNLPISQIGRASCRERV